MLNRNWNIFIFFAIIYFTPFSSFGQIHDQLKWGELPPIPHEEGLSGMYAGVSSGALVIMGGANFVDGEKTWYDNIYILEENASGWKLSDKKLPRALAYGVSFSYEDKIIIAGGSNGQNHFSDVYSIAYVNEEIKIDTLPSLPYGLANMAGALVGDTFFVAGGNKDPTGVPLKSFLAYHLNDQEWTQLQPWPGPARIEAVSAALQGNFFVFSGINTQENINGKIKKTILKDGYKFIPADVEGRINGGQWIPLSEMPRGVASSPSPAPTFGLHHILFPGGLDDSAGEQRKAAELTAYHVESDRWLNFGDFPRRKISIAAPTIEWNERWVISGGETGSGKGSAVINLSKENVQFGWINWIAVLLYMAVMIWMGYIFSKRGKTTDDFFKAGGRIPWWAAGVSIYATQLSAITFMAVPAIVFATDWSTAIGSIMILAIVPVIIKFYLPFFRRLNVTSAYEYLENRFSGNVRLLGSLSFILLQLGRMGIVLYLPALALSAVTGIDIYLLIGVMGVISIIYTVMGGIEAVIWTDVIQVFVLLGGAIACILLAISNIEGGLNGMIVKGVEANKFVLFHLGWDPDRLVLWVGLVGFFFINLIPYTSDQTVVQRYLTVRDEKAAAKGLWVNGLAVLPAVAIFSGLGTALFIYYQDNPTILPSEEVRNILPHFVVSELPVGFAGVVIAGIFAASMSSLDSSMNSVSTSYISDIHKRFRPRMDDREYLRIAKQVTVAMGVFGTASAMVIVALDVQIIFDLFQEVVGLMGGGLAGIFILGIFTKRANAPGAITGIIAGALITWFIKQNTDISIYLYGAIGVISCVIVGYFASFFFPQEKKIEGFTYSTLIKKDEQFKQ